MAGAGDGGGGVVEELNIMINSVMKNQEPQMNADKRRFVVPVLSSSLALIEKNQNKNHFFPYFAVKNRRFAIILFENHRGHRKKWQPSEFSLYSVVDYLFKYSILQKKLKSLSKNDKE